MVASREVAKKMPIMLQQYKSVTEFSGAFCFLQSRLVTRGIGMAMQCGPVEEFTQQVSLSIAITLE